MIISENRQYQDGVSIRVPRRCRSDLKIKEHLEQGLERATRDPGHSLPRFT